MRSSMDLSAGRVTESDSGHGDTQPERVAYYRKLA